MYMETPFAKRATEPIMSLHILVSADFTVKYVFFLFIDYIFLLKILLFGIKKITYL